MSKREYTQPVSLYNVFHGAQATAFLTSSSGKGASMNLQNSLKTILVLALAACSAAPTYADSILTEVSASGASFSGGWAGPAGGSLTFDFAYNDTLWGSGCDPTPNCTIYSSFVPLTYALTTDGFLGSGVNLSPGGSNSGSNVVSFDTSNFMATQTISTPGVAPSGNYTGDAFGFSLVSTSDSSGNGSTLLDVIKNVFSDGVLDTQQSGTAVFSNVNIGASMVAPEMDPGSAATALVLLLGSLAVVGGRKLNKASV
jgi:hypothetical protein